MAQITQQVLWVNGGTLQTKEDIRKWAEHNGLEEHGVRNFIPHYILEDEKILTYALLKWPKHINQRQIWKIELKNDE